MKILQIESDFRPVRQGSDITGRCYVCVADIVGKNNYKNVKERLDNKFKTKCNKYERHICKNHSVFVLCNECI